jgi:predicted Zn-dependent protease
MIVPDFTLEGLFYDGKSPVSRPATLTIFGSRARLLCGETEKFYPKDSLLVSPQSGRADRFISFSDGGQYHCRDQELLADLPQEFIAEGIVAWLEKHIPAAIVSILLVIVMLGLGYFLGLPALAHTVSKKIPLETEANLGKHILTWLDENNMFSPSEIEKENREQLVKRFTALHGSLHSSSHIQLHFRNGNAIGPNAFALPGGNIVITDQLIEMATSHEEILSILAHEAGHVEKRHALRNILQSSIVVLAVSSITSDVSMLGGAMASLPVLFLQSKYSRGFEEEADTFAIRLLEENGISPRVFADILERLDMEHGFPRQDFSFLSTHPVTSKRVEKIRNPR